MGALIERRTIAQILSIWTAALQVSSSIVVTHFQPLGAITLVGLAIEHIAVLTVTLSSNIIQCGSRWAFVWGRD